MSFIYEISIDFVELKTRECFSMPVDSFIESPIHIFLHIVFHGHFMILSWRFGFFFYQLNLSGPSAIISGYVFKQPYYEKLKLFGAKNVKTSFQTCVVCFGQRVKCHICLMPCDPTSPDSQQCTLYWEVDKSVIYSMVYAGDFLSKPCNVLVVVKKSIFLIK